MEIRAGYKQTDIGIIPEDWEVIALGKVGNFSKGSGVRKDEALSGEIPCIRYGEIYTRHNNYIKQFYSFISKDIAEIAKKLKKGDVLFAGSGETKEEIGKSVAFIDDFEAYAGGDIVILSPTNADPLYLGYLLNAPFIQKQKASRGQGDAVVHISATQLGNVSIPLPPTKAEQTPIATALSDADTLITSLEKLITKKRNIKQGAMQNLLQPKKGWETKTLKELAKYRRGSFPQPYGLDKWYDDTNGYPFVQVYDVDDNFRLKSETKRRISKAAQEMSVYIEKGSVIITLQGSIGRIAITQYDDYVDRTLLFFESFLVPFDKFFFMLSIFRLFELEKEIAPGGIIKTITKEALSSFKITYPKIEEQTEIATILSDMDREIEALEIKLEKYRNVKTGMMQNLLTGKIRLV